MQKGMLTFFCAKMGAGKTTKAKEIAKLKNAVLISEDEWLESLYPDEISSLNDYVTYSNRLKTQLKPLVQSLLTKGIDVVMDFPANTVKQRQWLKFISDEIGSPHELVFIDLPDAICLERIEKRKIKEPHRAKTDTAEMFHQVTQYFNPPSVDEGFDIIKISTETN